jgi:two-component system chemotaxis response regulator CheY
VLTAGNVLLPVWFIDLRRRAGYLRDIPLALEEFLLARKILLADDSVTAQNMGRKILADAGYEVIAVNNGSAALKKIAELKPDLVILDVYMPGYSGLEVCQRLKESQETARIPVLLTVGKLEPFKPEEAQRVRAEGYIVKPFEASELLSALAKLEDKIVPRAEPSKPGRFARAIAAADETDRNGKKEPSRTETGWKNRIAFPSKKTQPEESAEEARPANGAQTSAGNKEKPHDSSRTEVHVDVAAFAPIGVPKDVSPAEVAAIAAAAAQMQMAEASTRNERRNSGSAASQTTSEFPVEPSSERFQDLNGNAAAEASSIEPNVAAASSELPAAELDQTCNGNESSNREKSSGEKLDDRQDAPVTMAAAPESAVAEGAGLPRWTAVPVALESNETSLSLDHEMHQAYAAFAAADHATSAGTVEAETAVAEPSSAQPQAIVETPATVTSMEEPVAAIAEPSSVPEPEPVPAVASIETSPTPDPATFDPATPDGNLAPSAELTSSPDTAIVDSAPAMQTTAEVVVPAVEISTTPTDAVTSIPETSEPKPDSETVKTTAAAWANWRQIRDTGARSSEHPEAKVQDSVTHEFMNPDNAALAVAAGAESVLQDVPSVPSNGNPTDVASIVDSVLAGLRPKLMEEITRKMAEKK